MHSKELFLQHSSELGQIDVAILIELDLLEKVVGLGGAVAHAQPRIQAQQQILGLFE